MARGPSADRGVVDEERAGHGVHARGPDDLAGPVRERQLDIGTGRDLARRPVVGGESAAAERLDAAPEPLDEGRRAARSGRPAARTRPRAARSSSRRARAGRPTPASPTFMPMPTMTRGSFDPSPSVSPRTPASLRTPDRPARRTRSLGHLRRICPSERPASVLGRLGHRERRHGRELPRAGRVQPGRPEPEREQDRGAARRDPRPPVAPAPGRLLVGDREADLGRALGEPVADDVVRRADDGESLRPGEESVHGVVRSRQPAAATSTASGRSSSKASWSARRAVSSSSSAMMQVIRTSDVEIISMLTPASASVPNIRAA